MLKPVGDLTWMVALLVSHRSQMELIPINFTVFYFVHELPLIHEMLPGFAVSGTDIQPV